MKKKKGVQHLNVDLDLIDLVEISSFSPYHFLINYYHFPPMCILYHHSLQAVVYIPDSEDSGDVPAPISSLSLQMRQPDLPELVDCSAVRCPLLHQEGVCRVVSEDSGSSCGSRVCEGTITLSSRPAEKKH